MHQALEVSWKCIGPWWGSYTCMAVILTQRALEIWARDNACFFQRVTDGLHWNTHGIDLDDLHALLTAAWPDLQWLGVRIDSLEDDNALFVMVLDITWPLAGFVKCSRDDICCDQLIAFCDLQSKSHHHVLLVCCSKLKFRCRTNSDVLANTQNSVVPY